MSLHLRHFTMLLLLAVCFLGLLPARLAGQSTFGTIVGTVRDSSLGVIPGVGVKVVELDTNASREAVTDDNGYYEVTLLNPGRYELQAEHPGFQRFVQRGIVLETSGRARVDITLEVGETSSQITVEADVPPIETETSSISTIQDKHVYAFMPVDAIRMTFRHLILASGVMAAPGAVYTIHGSRGWSNGFSIDGTNTGDPVSGAQESEQRTPVDFIQEARIGSVGNSAEYSHPGHFNVTTKSGTNQFNGAAEYTHQNSAFGARSVFAATRPQRRSHYYTGHISGPLVLPKLYDGHDRTFILLGYNGFALPGEQLLTPSVPSERMRQGDFSRLFNAQGNLVPIRDPLTGQPFQGNIIPAGRLSNVALNYQEIFYPRPNFGAADLLSANFRTTLPETDIQNDIHGRIDHQISDKNRLILRLTRQVLNTKSNSTQLPVFGRGLRVRRNHSWTIADTHSFSPNLLNEFRIGGYNKWWPQDGSRFGREVVEEVGLTGYPGELPADIIGVPTVNITGFTSIADRQTSLQKLFNVDVHNIITWIRRDHSLKFGLNVLQTRNSAYPATPSAVFGTFGFTGFATGNAYADFLLGIPRTSSRSEAVPTNDTRNHEYAVFIQDDWKVTPSLTLNLGLRYQRVFPFLETDGRIANFDPATGSVVIPDEATRAWIDPLYPANIPIVTAAQAGFPTSRLLDSDSNFAPRIGFAYRLGQSVPTVIRGGFGIFYNSESRKVPLVGGPFVGSETYDNVITGGQPLYAWPRAFPGATARPLGVQNITASNPHLKDSYTQQWNLTLERVLWLETGMRVSYIGHASRQLPFRRDLNQIRASTVPFSLNRRPYPQFNSITYSDSGANQSYNAFQIEASRRFSGGLAFDVHYTFSKNLTDALDSNPLGALIEDSFDRTRERGNETYTPRQRALASFIYDLPFGRNKWIGTSLPRSLDKIIGGWTLSGILTWRTGLYFTPTFSGSDPSNTGKTSGRPDRLREGSLPSSERSLARWFDVNAFAVPANGRFGNSGVNILEGPGAWIFNAGMFKTIPIHERLALRINANFRNLFNHPTAFAPPASNISAVGQVGRITGFSSAILREFSLVREGYVTIRLEW